ncbi:hypothetical protein [Miltoncostaea oceani]|uniref:hypothetical protein n=1 Tax=Miltoncostaea oceani TaxID=2843216 RepID=UPI001C3CD788|nr:hypothetical protein [Miltoncostaea oceani]
MALADNGTITLVGSGSFPGTAWQRLSPLGGIEAGGFADRRQSYDASAAGVDAHGNVTALWMRGTNLVAGTLRAGARTWRVRVIANTGLYSPDVALAVSRGGDAAVAFRGRARGVRGPRFPSRAPTARVDRDIQALTYSAADSRWSRAVRLSATGVPATAPRVAIDGSGRATVAWAEGPNNGQGLTRIKAADGSSGSWSQAVTVSDPASDPIAPALAASDNGRATIAWTGCRGGSAGVYFSEKAGTEWSEPRVIG